MNEQSIQEVFNFNDNTTFIENLHVLPNGKILLSTFQAKYSGDLLIVNPDAKPASFKSLVSLPGSTGLTGIAHLGEDIYAVTGGMHLPFRFEADSMSVYVVKVDAETETGILLGQIPVPGTEMLNGMDSIPANPHVVLSVDSIGGRIFRIDTRTKNVDVAFADSQLVPRDGIPLGGNGLKIKGNCLYFTNSASGEFNRVVIDSLGNMEGPIETIAKLENVSMASGNLYDDFDITSSGDAYLSVHFSAINQITKIGIQSTIAGGFSGTLVKDPTSVAIARDEKSVYVGTGGAGSGGQVLKITL